MAALSRMSRGEHRSITLTAGDLIILSSSLIPGNEEAVYGVIDALAKIGARVVTNAQARVHVTGHAYAGELMFLYNGVRPRNVMPVHGTWRHLRANAKLAATSGVPEENVVIAENGVSVDLVAGKASIAGAVPVGKMFVDGLITGDVGDATLGERLILSSGFIAVTVVVHRGTGRPAGPAHLLSRGFSEDPKALEPVARKVEAELESLAADTVTDPGAHRPGGAAHRRQVGGGDLPPSADDRADGHRDLTVRATRWAPYPTPVSVDTTSPRRHGQGRSRLRASTFVDEARVDRQRDAGDVARLVGHQPGHRRGDVLGLAVSAPATRCPCRGRPCSPAPGPRANCG